MNHGTFAHSPCKWGKKAITTSLNTWWCRAHLRLLIDSHITSFLKSKQNQHCISKQRFYFYLFNVFDETCFEEARSQLLGLEKRPVWLLTVLCQKGSVLFDLLGLEKRPVWLLTVLCQKGSVLFDLKKGPLCLPTILCQKGNELLEFLTVYFKGCVYSVILSIVSLKPRSCTRWCSDCVCSECFSLLCFMISLPNAFCSCICWSMLCVAFIFLLKLMDETMESTVVGHLLWFCWTV